MSGKYDHLTDAQRANFGRAETGLATIKFFEKETASEVNTYAENVSDLLADLMHWCEQEKMDFDACLETARHNYIEEVREAT